MARESSSQVLHIEDEYTKECVLTHSPGSKEVISVYLQRSRRLSGWSD